MFHDIKITICHEKIAILPDMFFIYNNTRVYKFHKLDSLICIFHDIIVFVPTV